MSICSLGSQGEEKEERFSGSVIAGNKKGDPNERRGVRIVAKGRRGGGNFSREPFPGARFSVGETFIVPTKLLYLSIGKTKASYLFLFPYSPRHVSFRFPVSFFFNARHVLLLLSSLSSRFCTQHAA